MYINATERSEIDFHIYNFFFFVKSTKTIPWTNDGLFKKIRKTFGHLYAKKNRS